MSPREPLCVAPTYDCETDDFRDAQPVRRGGGELDLVGVSGDPGRRLAGEDLGRAIARVPKGSGWRVGPRRALRRGHCRSGRQARR